MKLAIVCAALVAACSATPRIDPEPLPDGGASIPASVCRHLAALDCPEGKDAGCVAVTRRVMSSGIVAFDARCVLAATTQEAARACPAVRCKP